MPPPFGIPLSAAKTYSRQVLADLNDFPQMIEALQVAGIVPAK